MATTLFLRITSSDYGLGTNTADLSGSGVGWAPLSLATARGSGVTALSRATVAGPTNGLEVLSSGISVEWLSDPLDADVTISGSITWNLWASESSMSANVAINGRLEVIDGATGTITLIDQTARTAEVAVTTRAVNNFAETPAAGVACKRGDRLRVRIFGDDSTANMGSGFTFDIGIDGTTAGADGDTFLTLTETLSFASEPTGTQVFLTDTASAVSTSSVDREAWTSRGGGVQNDVTNTATGWTSPIHVTDTAGGTVVDWFTRPLAAVTLGGAVRCNIRAAESATSANANIKVEIAVVDGDGTNPVVWAVGAPSAELDTTEAAASHLISGDDTSVAEGKRLRIRLYIDDHSRGAMGSGSTVTTYYAGTSGGASGDTFLTFTQTLTEFAAVEAVPRFTPYPQLLAH